MKIHLSIVAAVVLVAVGMLGSASAFGQYRTGDDGHALDANNRIGSGGYNTGRPRQGPTQDQIFYGNVSGGQQFRGTVTHPDPFAFRGTNVGSAGMDRFNRNTAGAPVVGGQVQNPQGTAQAYYQQSRLAPPPPGAAGASTSNQYVLNPITGSYTPAPPPDRRMMAGDTRLGRPLGDPLPPLPMPGELMLPGPVDPGQTGGILTASPLYGLREWRSGERELLNSTGPRGPIEIAAIERMRSELMTSGAVDAQGNPVTGNTGALTGPNLNQTMQIGAPIESPRPMQLTTDPLDAVLGSKKLPAQPGDVGTQQTLRQRILAPAEQQSTQVAELRKRYAQFAAAQPKEQTDQEANVEFQRGWRAKQANEQAKGALLKEPMPAVVKPGEQDAQGQQQPGVGQGGTAQTPVAGGEGAAAPVEKPQPLNITSLAEGVKAKGLNELLTSAEQLAKQGKFSSAVAQYERAEQVAPNNPLIWIGRANAELGAGFFLRAEQNLRAAFRADPSLLVGKYDLKNFLGEERLKELTTDLQELADDEPTQTRPLFLLAWVAYNTGEERKAAAYLDLAEKRSNGRDGVYKLLRDSWTLPKSEENK